MSLIKNPIKVYAREKARNKKTYGELVDDATHHRIALRYAKGLAWHSWAEIYNLGARDITKALFR